MACPFDAEEKQALLEARDPSERARALLALLEINAFDDGHDDDDAPKAS
jgi:Lon protease-like protein